MLSKSWWFATSVAGALLVPNEAGASPCSPVSRDNVVRCAVEASLDRKAAGAGVRAATGRVDATDPWLPAPPTLALSGARREGAAGTALNWSANLGIELELAGQRGARREAAVAEQGAARATLEGAERAAAVEALRSYFEALAAKEATETLLRLEVAVGQVRDAAVASSQRGATPGVEADVAEATHLTILRQRLEAARSERSAKLSLAVHLGRAPEERLDVQGALEPLAAAGSVRDTRELGDPADVLAFEAERRASSARAGALRRSRVPNPTVSAFVERDGYYENVIGLGISFPLPLPEPVGRMHAGEIAEQEALSERAGLLASRGRKHARLELADALDSYRAAVEVERAFSRERVTRAETALRDLGTEVAAGRLAIRDAIAFQEPLLGLLLQRIEARKALCLASVELVRAAGLPLAGGAR